MKYILLISIISLSIILSSCNNSAKRERNKLYTIDFEQCMATVQPMRMSEIADTVEYLELKTPKDVIITRIWEIIPMGDFMILHTRDGVFKFTKKGDFIKKIGHSGQGPGEYTLILGVDIDPLKKVIIMADISEQVLVYDLDGNFLRSEKWGFLHNIGLSDSALWVSELAIPTNKYIAFALNPKGDTIASISNPHYGMKSKDAGMGVSQAKYLKPFYRYKGSLYLKGKEVNDTIYQLSGADCMPYAFLNMGKYKLPIEYEAWYSYDEHDKFGSRYWGIPSVAEDDYRLFLTSLRSSSVDGNKYVHNEENYRYIVYDKEKRKGFVVKGEEGTKITDDILGGPAIWPRWVTDHYYMSTVEWYELSEEIKKGNYTLAPALEKQFAGFGYSTNELIVLCRRN